jgi:hypothetical protein
MGIRIKPPPAPINVPNVPTAPPNNTNKINVTIEISVSPYIKNCIF